MRVSQKTQVMSEIQKHGKQRILIIQRDRNRTCTLDIITCIQNYAAVDGGMEIGLQLHFNVHPHLMDTDGFCDDEYFLKIDPSYAQRRGMQIQI